MYKIAKRLKDYKKPKLLKKKCWKRLNTFFKTNLNKEETNLSGRIYRGVICAGVQEVIVLSKI